MPAALFSPLTIGPYRLEHRVVMAPLTRMRADKATLAPRPLNVDYYAQRATPGGLIIAEATPVLPTGTGSPNVPGIYSEAQIAGWKHVVDAVHAKGGVIFLQLWHVGRVSHSSFQPGGALPVAPSAIAISDDLKAMTADGKVAAYETPRALETDEIPGIVAAYGQAARNAIAAGFDGVEVHGANGYLIEQFLQTRSNQRTDRYGGSIENRCRFLLEVTQAVIDACGAAKVGVRLSPYGIANGSGEAEPMPLYTYAIEALNRLGIAYLHLIEPRSSGAGRADVNWQNVPSALALFRPVWKGVLIGAGGFTGEPAEAAIKGGHADAIAFGRYFISNPDLPQRLAHGWPLTPYHRPTFYGGEDKGYTDYPAYDEMAPA
ncbi:NADH-dependent flavin oxidoreductase [Bradyrhizobium oligotrophicum S58]|uniref:NADH-dependent flavin oxidoreductase n=1 Tax=Bradyrhizobium oligotrophicum S58 TaxID=1245469 RepID=M4ZES6_9BRAD|nr:alkene reductase [Bradyrhizobium oligotrophicum]BAM92318.1 NADH-dependent flavin oxidoreductase [Bradyrhizobium oligotrophicum S58]